MLKEFDSIANTTNRVAQETKFLQGINSDFRKIIKAVQGQLSDQNVHMQITAKEVDNLSRAYDSAAKSIGAFAKDNKKLLDQVKRSSTVIPGVGKQAEALKKAGGMGRLDVMPEFAPDKDIIAKGMKLNSVWQDMVSKVKNVGAAQRKTNQVFKTSAPAIQNIAGKLKGLRGEVSDFIKASGGQGFFTPKHLTFGKDLAAGFQKAQKSAGMMGVEVGFAANKLRAMRGEMPAITKEFQKSVKAASRMKEETAMQNRFFTGNFGLFTQMTFRANAMVSVLSGRLTPSILNMGMILLDVKKHGVDSVNSSLFNMNMLLISLTGAFRTGMFIAQLVAKFTKLTLKIQMATANDTAHDFCDRD